MPIVVWVVEKKVFYHILDLGFESVGIPIRVKFEFETREGALIPDSLTFEHLFNKDALLERYPNLKSELLGIFKQVHQDVLDCEPKVVAIHAGLECGILGEKFEGMDMISFGPTLRGVHAPGEKLSIPSTARFYDLLNKIPFDIGVPIPITPNPGTKFFDDLISFI